MNTPKQSSISSAVSLTQKDTDLGVSWSDSLWIPHLNSFNVMEYFSQPSNPFYDPQCNNEIIRMQRQSLDQLRNMVGIEFELAHAQDPILYIVKKQQRLSPTEAHTLAHYYILAGIVYQAPDLWSVINSRLLNTSHFLFSAATDLNNYVRYHPSNGYHWEVKNASGGEKKIAFVPLDEMRKEGEETGTQFQRKNVDQILSSLTQKFPFKQMPTTQHPYGPRVVTEQPLGSVGTVGPIGTMGAIGPVGPITMGPMGPIGTMGIGPITMGPIGTMGAIGNRDNVAVQSTETAPSAPNLARSGQEHQLFNSVKNSR